MDFKQRSSKFVKWFANNQLEMELLVNQGKFQEVSEMIHTSIEEFFVGLSISLYKKNNMFILEFESVLNNSKKLVSFFLCQELRKLEIKNWKFLYYHPALKVGLTYDTKHISAEMIDIIPTEKDGISNIAVLKNAFLNQFNKEQQYSFVYMLLIDTLGEFFVEQKVGKISIVPNVFIRKKNKQTLSNYAKQKKALKVVEQGLMLENYSFKSDSKEKRFDIIEGVTYDIEFLNQEINNHVTPSRDFFKDNGIRVYSYVFGNTNQKNQHEIKEIEKKLDSLFKKDTQGLILNWAKGNKYSYLDCLVFSEEIIEEMLKIASDNAIEIIML